nr:RHS repeat protein [Deltaproteobacteria bacterium]
MATVTDPQNRQMAFAYDSNGIDPLFVDHRTSTSPVQYQRVSAYSNFVRHRPTSVTDAAGQTTVYQYNCRGQVLSRMRPGGAVTTYTYDSPSSNANPPCSGTEGRLVSVSGPGGTVSLSTYTNRNLPRVVTDLNGLAKTYTFDALDRVTRVDLPDGSHNAVTYVQRDDQGQPRLDAGVPVPGLEPTQFTDRGGQITTRSYDRAQRLIYNNDPNGHVTRYNYCCGSGLSSISDSLAHQTTWVRDDTLSGRLDNRPVKMIRADGTTVAYEYDRAGRLSAETNGQLDGDPSEPGYRAVYEYNLDATVGERRGFGGRRDLWPGLRLRPLLSTADFGVPHAEHWRHLLSLLRLLADLPRLGRIRRRPGRANSRGPAEQHHRLRLRCARPPRVADDG